MTDDSKKVIKALAEKCARSNLTIRSSVALFDALYAADALLLSGGSMTEAAKRAGMDRQSLVRLQKRSAKGAGAAGK